MSRETPDQQTLPRESSYHGPQEGYGSLFFGFAIVEGLFALALPWLDVLIVAHKRGGSHQVWLALTNNVLFVAAISAFIQVYRALSRQIAQSGPAAGQLDQLRLRVAIMTGTLWRFDAPHLRRMDHPALESVCRGCTLSAESSE